MYTCKVPLASTSLIGPFIGCILLVADVRMSSSVLVSLGVRLDNLDKEGFYSELLAAVKERKVGRDVVTNQFISEISDRMGDLRPGVATKDPSQI